MKIEREVSYKEKYDVIIVGGGIAGVAAAVAAARGGVRTLLLEKSINLGGLATGGLISWYEPLCDGKGKQLIYSISEELIRLSCQYGFHNLPPKWGGSGENKTRNDRYSTYYSPGIFSALLDRFVLESGASIRFDSLATYPVMEDHLCKGVIVEDANGSEYFEAEFVIDATGDASVMHRAGVPTVDGKNYMSYIAHAYYVEDIPKLMEDHDICAFRKWMKAGSNMVGEGHPEGMEMISGTTTEEITEYVIYGKQAMLHQLSKLPQNRFDIMAIPTMPQFRTIRRIVGNTDFCAIDGQEFEDCIGLCGDFRKKGIGNCYQIPMGSLFHPAYPNLIAAGRIISAPQGDGWEVARVIPACALTGEAAGKAAALGVKQKKTLLDFTIEDVKKIKV